MVTHTEQMYQEEQHRIEIRAPRRQDDQRLLVREPGAPRVEDNPAPFQRSIPSTPPRERGPDPSPRSTIATEETPERQARYSRPPPPRRRVAILIMGGTGTGKSTFIAEVTGQRVQIGHDLVSCK